MTQRLPWPVSSRRETTDVGEISPAVVPGFGRGPPAYLCQSRADGDGAPPNPPAHGVVRGSPEPRCRRYAFRLVSERPLRGDTVAGQG